MRMKDEGSETSSRNGVVVKYFHEDMMVRNIGFEQRLMVFSCREFFSTAKKRGEKEKTGTRRTKCMRE